MKVVVKTVGGSKFEVAAEPTHTICQLKELLSSEHGLPAGGQKLIYVGKILKDAQTLESVGFVETGFLACVIMKGKKKVPAALPLVDAAESRAASPQVSPSESSREAEQEGVVTDDQKELKEEKEAEEEKPSVQQIDGSRCDMSASSGSASSGSGFRAARAASHSGGSLMDESLSDEAVEAARAVEVKEKEAKIKADAAAAAQKKAEGQRRLFQSTAQILRDAEEAMMAAQNEFHLQKQALLELKVDAQHKERAARKAAEDVAKAKKKVEAVLTGTAYDSTSVDIEGDEEAEGSGSSSSSGSSSAASTFTLPTDSPLLMLIDHPTIDFEQMRRRVQADGTQLGLVLQDIGAVDPELLAAINRHQTDFIALMNQGIERVRQLQEQARAQQQQHITFAIDDAFELASQAGMMGFWDQEPDEVEIYGNGDDEDDDLESEAGPDEDEQPTRMTVELSEGEMEAIQRIVRMGYNRNQVIEAFVMCGRNELVAASYLMEGMEGMEGMGGGASGYDECGGGYEYPFDDAYGYEPEGTPDAAPAVTDAAVGPGAMAEVVIPPTVVPTTSADAAVAEPTSAQKKPTTSEAAVPASANQETETPDA
jgi:hypothetical protein